MLLCNAARHCSMCGCCFLSQIELIQHMLQVHRLVAGATGVAPVDDLGKAVDPMKKTFGVMKVDFKDKYLSHPYGVIENTDGGRAGLYTVSPLNAQS
jgi:hypothetical protein